MTKRELLKKMDELLNEKGMSKIETLGGKIGEKDNKAMIESAISCLEATDEEMNDYLTVIKSRLNATYRETIKDENWMINGFKRFYIYSTAKSILKAF